MSKKLTKDQALALWNRLTSLYASKIDAIRARIDRDQQLYGYTTDETKDLQEALAAEILTEGKK